MRITLITIGFYEYTIELANALSESEDVFLIIPQNKVSNPELISKKVRRLFICKPRMRYPTNLKMIHKIFQYINFIKPDIIHLQSGFGPWICVLLSFFKKYAFVTTIHDPETHSGEEAFYYNLTTKFLQRYSDRIIAQGKASKNCLINKFGVKVQDIDIIPLGASSFFTKWKKENIIEEKNTVLFFGRIWKYKGLEYLIKAEPIISAEIPDFKIIIAGRGENFKKYKNIMVNRERFIVVNRYIPNENVAELFQKASLVVLPYIEATQSAIISIAYAFKKPVVVTNVGSLPEYVDDGITGCIVPPRNSDKLAGAIIRLLKNNSARKKIGENGYKKMLKEFSWERIAKKHLEVYKKTIVEHRKKRWV
ncbi:glycosyltransferase family 4 protein [candidate division WOR-3 bacterium]|nr:glycosyltransferase family 4 protein [candidate division WOR-3 bacterium]